MVGFVFSQRGLINMEMRKDDSFRNVNKEEHEEEHEEEMEKVLVPVRCRKDTHEEQHSEEPGKEKVWKIRRRWYIY